MPCRHCATVGQLHPSSPTPQKRLQPLLTSRLPSPALPLPTPAAGHHLQGSLFVRPGVPDGGHA